MHLTGGTRARWCFEPRPTLAQRFAAWRREWLPSLSDRRDRFALIAIALVAALIGAPTSRLVRAACDLCPPSCPMHHPEHVKANKPSCHGVDPAAVHHADHQADGGAPTFARPPCRDAGGLAAAVVNPMILTAAPHAWRPSESTGLRPAGAPARDRAADPPESPPPIALA